jgi:HEAT repeat protein
MARISLLLTWIVLTGWVTAQERAPAVAALFVPALAAGQAGPTLDELVEQFKRAGFVAQLDLGKQIVERRDVRALTALERRLTDEDRHRRANVAFVFAALGDDRGYHTLAGILSDRSARPEGRGQGIPMGRWTSERQTESDRYYAIHVLGELKTTRAADLVFPLMQDRSVSYKAAWALGEIGDPRAVPALIAALRDQDALVRVIAIQALEQLRATEAIPHLRTLLTDEGLPRAGDRKTVAETARHALAALER